MEEKVELPMNAYAITIAAFLFPGDTPIVLRQNAVKSCLFIFMLQSAMAYYFIYEVRHMENFQKFDMVKTCLRLIISLLV
jgi:hypothetical protein